MIRTLQDLRKFAGADWKDVSDEDLVTAYAKKVNIDPAEVGIQLGMYAGDGGKNSKRLSSSIDSYQANLYGLGEAIAEKAGFSGVQEAMGRRRRANEFEAAVQSQRAKEMGAVDRFADVNSASDFGDYAVGLGIQSLPYLGEALGGGVIGRGVMMGTKAALRGAEAAGDVAAANRARTALNRGATAGAVGASYPSAVGDVLSSQRDQADTMDLGSAAALGIPYAALNAFGLEGALARRSGFRSGIEALDNISGIKGGLARMGATGLRTGLTEAVTETAQEGLNQVGRMQVDPNETFFNERSAERFLESAIGGGLLGGIGGAGLGGWRRSKPVDLLGTANPTPPTQEEIAAEQTAAAQAQTAAEINQSPARVSNVFSEQQQRLIDMGVRPTKKAMDLLDEIDASGLAPEQLTGVTTAMAQNKYKRAATLLADAIIEAKKNPQPAAAAPTAPVAPTPAPTDVNQAPQAVQAQEEKPKVRRVTAAEAAAQQAAIQPPAEVLGDPAGAAPEAPVVTTPPAEPVVQRKQKRVVTPAAPAQAFVAEEPAEQTEPVVETPQAAAPLAEQDLADIAEATGQGALAQAQQEEEAGARQDAPDVDPKEALDQIFQAAFESSSNPQRNTEIAKAYITSMANAPKGSKAKIAEAIGAKYGVGAKTVAALGNTTHLVAVGEKLGYTPQQVREMLGVGNNTKSAPKAELTPEQADRQEAMQDQADRAAKSQALEAAGISSEEGETSGLGGDDKSETWKQGGKGAGDTANAKDEAIANEVQSLLEKQDELRQTAEELRDQGQDQAAEAIEEQIAALDAKVTNALKKYETFLEGKKSKKSKSSVKNEEATTAERASQAWDNVAADIDGAPSFDELTDEDQQTFMEFGEDNWSPRDVKQFMQRMSYGKNDAKVKKPYTAKELTKELQGFVRTAISARKLVIVDTINDLLSSPDKDVRAVGVAMKLQNAFGVTVNGRAYLVADRIQKGEGRAKFMHEVGAHLGMERLLGDAEFEALARKVFDWAKRDDGSRESKIAKKALARVENAATPDEDLAAEAIAYFVEEAMLDGINPTATKLPAFFDWFRRLYAAMKSAIRKLFGTADNLVAQDVVNLAFGAARLEVAGTFHGTAADFKKFNHDFMGKGEGAQAFGWGTYVAEKFGIASGYREDDVKRKTVNGVAPEGNVFRIDTSVQRNELLDWNRQLSKQPKVFAKIEAKLPQDIVEYAEDFTGYRLNEMYGQDLYKALVAAEGRHGMISDEFPDVNDYNKRLAKRDEQGVVSAYLDEIIGVPGIKFFDATSRYTPSKTLTFKGKVYTKSDLRAELANLRTGLANAESDTAYAQFRALLSVYNIGVAATIEKERESIGQRSLETLKWLEENAKDIKIETEPDKRTRNLVIFNDKNVLRVGSMRGGDPSRMKFGTNLPTQFQEPVRNTVERLQDAGRYVLNNFTFTEDLINRAKSLGITAAGQLQTIYRQRASLQGRLERDVERVAQLYNKVPEQERGTGASSVNKFIYDATREGKWGFEPDWRQKKPPMDAAMQRRFDGLSKESQALVRAVFKHGDDVLAEKKRTVQDAINGEYDQAIKDAQAAGETEKVTKLTNAKNQQVKKFQSLLKLTEFKPYAPMKRFGDYVVIARSAKYMAATPKEKTKLESSPDDYHVNFAESPAAAREMQRELEAQGSFAEVIVREKEKAQGEMYNGTLDAFTKLRAAVESDLANTTDPKQKAAVNRMQGIITELYLSSLAESSARKAEMRRRGVAGELDMLRSFATQGRADAMFLASAKYSDASFKAINEMRKQVKAGGNQLAKSETFNEIMARHFASLKYDYSPFTDRVTRLTSIWFLATSPMYYLQNLTQPFMMSLPFMTKRHSYAASASELIKAYTDLGPMFKNLKLGEQFNFAAAPADVRAAISELVDRGRIDIGINTELGKIQLEEGSALRRGWNKVDRYLSDLSQKMEAVNRLSTAIAAYRMEMKKPGATAASALEYADSVLAQTHGDYTRINAPRAFNTNLGRVMLQFRKFQLIQLTLMAKLIKDLKDPKERAAAGKALAFILGHTAVMAGVVGLPGFATISWLLGKVLGDDDEPFDLEVALREVIGDNDVASLILRGAPTVAGVDLSGKVGMGNLLAILPFNDLDLSARSGVESAMANLLGGPFGGLVIRAADGLGLISKGDYYKGLEQLLPTGISNAMKGYRTATDGVTRRNGDVLVSAEEVGALSGFAQALGIPLSSTTERTLLSKYKLDTEEGLRNAATRIKNDFLKARKEGDGEAMGEAREAWMQLQDRRMELGFSRQPMSGLLNASKEQSGRERNTIGGIQFDKNSRRFVENLVEDDDED